MQRYVLLLRGINVGGKNTVSMRALAQGLEDLGYVDVKTYINSGNALVSSERSAVEVRTEVEDALPRLFMLDDEQVKVLVLTDADLQAVVRDKPPGFGEQPDVFHSDAVFLIDLAAQDALKVFDPRPEVDAVWPGDGVIYSQRLSAQRTKSRLGKIVGTPEYRSMTIRSWKTVLKILDLLETSEGRATARAAPRPS
jgi:uncharacterized protein (DUF1697 family)